MARIIIQLSNNSSMQDALRLIEEVKRKKYVVDAYLVSENASQQMRAADLLPCGHPKSSLVQLRFGSRPYCEDCKRATIR